MSMSIRKPFLAGNWKMNKTVKEAEEFTFDLKAKLKEMDKDVDVLICPPFTALTRVKDVIDGKRLLGNHQALQNGVNFACARNINIKLGAQNCSYAESGAYTGEVSADMLKDAGCEYVILGHSERRAYFGDTDEIINEKTKMALSKGLKVIFCVGETLTEREADKTFEVINKQTVGGLKDVSLDNVVIAYEPVWAIGTGRTASPEQAEEVHAFIRNLIAKLYDKNAAENVRILYGGSVNPATIQGLMACPNVDGGLVGGASLKVADFSEIVKLA